MKHWDEVLNMVKNDDNGKWDAMESVKNLRMNPAGKLELNEIPATAPVEKNGGLGFTDHAFGQLCGRLEIPAKYMRRLPSELRATCMNYDLLKLGSQDAGKEFLIRAKGNAVRGILSDKYSRIDNNEIVEIFNGLASDFQNQVREFHIDDRGIWMKILIDDLRAWDPSHRASELKMGLLIGNSEVGCRAVSVEPFVYREACTNDMVTQMESSVRIQHIHIKPAQLRMMVAESMNKALKAGDEVMDRFVKAYEETVDRPSDVIAALAAKRGLSQEKTDAAKLAFAAEPMDNKFGVINAFTATARQLNGDDRVDMERFAGSLLKADLSRVKLDEVSV